MGQDVVYNQANESITIFKVPPNLKAQLLALLENNAKQNQPATMAVESSNEDSENDF